METKLALSLIERGIFGENSEITARYRSIGIDGQPTVLARQIFLVNGLIITENSVDMKLVSTRDGSQKLLPVSTVVEIDGMDPIRFAESFEIGPDGEKLIEKPRRGRKPKLRDEFGRPIEMKCLEDFDDLEDLEDLEELEEEMQ